MRPIVENSNRDPLPCLQEWQRLTSAETLAIEAGNWDELAQLHKTKGELKLQMEPLDFSHTDSHWKVNIIACEEKNRDLLQEKLDDLQLQLNEGNRSMNNIQRIHRAYGHQPLHERQTAPIWHQVT
jgi:hypothetical protein